MDLRLIDRSGLRSACARTIYDGADIDAYREQFGKEEGERRFFAEHAPTAPTVAEQDASADPCPPFDFDEIGPFDSVYIDTSQF